MFIFFRLCVSLHPKKRIMRLRLKDIMKERGMTNKAFAERLSKKPQYTSNVAHGRISVSLKMLERMANVLDVPLSELFI